MYKVFIDNFPKTYQLESEKELREVFSDHKFIEAAGGLVRRGKQFLFIKRHGKWDIPKGKLDKGESIEGCAVREIEEECGFVGPVIIDHLVNTWHTYETGKEKKVLKKTYWYLLEEGEKRVELIPQEEEGITEVRFFAIEDFDEVRSNTYGAIIGVMDALIGYLK